MGGFMPVGIMEAERTERECEALARVRANLGTLSKHHGKLAARAASEDRAAKVGQG